MAGGASSMGQVPPIETWCEKVGHVLRRNAGGMQATRPAPSPVSLINKVKVRQDPTKEESPCAKSQFKFTPTFTMTTTDRSP